MHMLIEADGKEALARGMKSIAARFAHGESRVRTARTGSIGSLPHARAPHAARLRNALAYVLLNVRKHWRQRHGVAPLVCLDIASSGAWFDGWKRSPVSVEPRELRAVAQPRFWLLTTGWRNHGLIDPAQTPG